MGSELQSEMAAQTMTIQHNHTEATTAISTTVETLTDRLDTNARTAKEDLTAATDRIGPMNNTLQQHAARVNAMERQLTMMIPSRSSLEATTPTAVADMKKSVSLDQRESKVKKIAFDAVQKECD